jgi:hypothetical protein
MSLAGKSLHVRLAPDIHERLAVLAGVKGDGLAEYAACLLEKTIIGEFHALSMQISHLKRLGLMGSERDGAVNDGRV